MFSFRKYLVGRRIGTYITYKRKFQELTSYLLTGKYSYWRGLTKGWNGLDWF